MTPGIFKFPSEAPGNNYLYCQCIYMLGLLWLILMWATGGESPQKFLKFWPTLNILILPCSYFLLSKHIHCFNIDDQFETTCMYFVQEWCTPWSLIQDKGPVVQTIPFGKKSTHLKNLQPTHFQNAMTGLNSLSN
jgi:hypothetical protein